MFKHRFVKNGIVPAGTVVNTDITNPLNCDFLLVSQLVLGYIIIIIVNDISLIHPVDTLRLLFLSTLKNDALLIIYAFTLID